MEKLTGFTFLFVVLDLSFGLELDRISRATERHARGLLDPLYKVKCGQACIGNQSLILNLSINIFLTSDVSCRSNCSLSVLGSEYSYMCGEVTDACIRDPETIIADSLATIENTLEDIDEQKGFRDVIESAKSHVDSISEKLTAAAAFRYNNPLDNCNAFSVNFINFLILLEVASDRNVEMVKLYNAAFDEAPDLLSLCSPQELKDLKARTDPKMSQVAVSISTYKSAKENEIKKLKTIVEESLEKIKDANEMLEVEGKPTIPPPGDLVPETIIESSVKKIEEADEEILKIDELKTAVGFSQTVLFLPHLSSSGIQDRSAESCDEFQSNLEEFLSLLSEELTDSQILQIVSFDLTAYRASVDECGGGADTIMEKLGDEIVQATDKLLVYGNKKVEAKNVKKEDIRKALEDIAEANLDLESDGKPTVTPPEVDFTFPMTTASAPVSESEVEDYDNVVIIVS